MLDWREIWRSVWPRNCLASYKTVHSNTCRMWCGIMLLKNKGQGTSKTPVAKQFSECRCRTAVLRRTVLLTRWIVRSVRSCWEQWTQEGTHERKTRSGVIRKTTRRDDRRIVRQALVDPTVTRSTIRADVGVAIVPQTISRHLAEANLKSKRPFSALPLTPEHRQLRQQWCQSKINVECHRLAKGCV
ncbi:HTH_Tnp_Tc3_2 domain-containing protein [Trichonephila clavipes]|nr:HTH_Tnp_Tc3_2 domain-containing protein [Trichonephila clavipes]